MLKKELKLKLQKRTPFVRKKRRGSLYSLRISTEAVFHWYKGLIYFQARLLKIKRIHAKIRVHARLRVHDTLVVLFKFARSASAVLFKAGDSHSNEVH